MAVGIVDRQKLVNIADAVRAKKGITGEMTLDAIASNITSIPTSKNNAKYDFSGSGSKSEGELLSYLTTVDLTGLDTSNYIDMNRMFSGCSLLTSLDVSNFDTSNVTYMNSMFQYCSSLTSLDLSSFNTSMVTYMSGMFDNCSSLTSLDLSSFNTSKVTNMSGMFASCDKLSKLTLGNDWASNSRINSFDLSSCPLTYKSAVDVINKLATRNNSPVIRFRSEVGLYQSEIDVATNKGWSVSGCTVLVEDPTWVDANTATVGQSALIDGVSSKCVYVADTPQEWGQRIFASQSSFTDSNGNYELEWGGYGTATGITATAIGTGLANTNALLDMNLQPTYGTPTIWDVLKEFRSKYGDRWFIPSRDEGFEAHKQGMNEMWTSSEYDSSNAYVAYKNIDNYIPKEKADMAYAFTYV